jgi:hypothetical protein
MNSGEAAHDPVSGYDPEDIEVFDDNAGEFIVGPGPSVKRARHNCLEGVRGYDSFKPELLLARGAKTAFGV